MVDMSNIMTEKLQMLVLRLEIGVEQKEVAAAARLAQATISRIERKKPTSLQAATQAWLGINKLRKEKGLPELRFDDIQWNIIGQDEKK